MTTQNKHTPLPWKAKVDEDKLSYAIFRSDENGYFKTAKCCRSDDARLIVESVNNHAKLVEALKYAQNDLKEMEELIHLILGSPSETVIRGNIESKAFELGHAILVTKKSISEALQSTQGAKGDE